MRAKQWFIVSLALLAVASLAASTRAQIEGTIRVVWVPAPGVYDCELHDTGPGVQTVAVLHSFSTGSTSSRFRIEADPGVTMTYLSETQHFPMTAGDTRQGMSICYDECATGDVVLVTMSYMAYGTSDNCSKIRVVPHPDATTVEAILCDGTHVRTYVRDMYMSVSGGCGCANAPPHSFQGVPTEFSCAVPVETTTWGEIKALYR